MKDVLLFKHNNIKGASVLTKRNNPCTGMKHTTVEYEEVFKHLDLLKLGKAEAKLSRNNASFLACAKKSCDEIAANIDAIDKWPKDVSVKQHDKLHKESAK